MEDLILDFLLQFPPWALYWIALGVLLGCGIGLPIPEDITLIAGGFACFVGLVDLGPMIAICLGGVILGDSIVFYLGAKYGRALTKKWIFHKLLPDDRLDLVRKKLDKNGAKFLFAARFMPGLRAPIFFSAGTLHVSYWRFLLYNGSAAVLSVPAIIGAVYYFGEQFDHIVKIIRRAEHGIIIVILLALAAILGKWYLTHRKLKKT